MDELLQQRIEFSKKIAEDTRLGGGRNYLSAVEVDGTDAFGRYERWLQVGELIDSQIRFNTYVTEALKIIVRSEVEHQPIEVMRELRRATQNNLDHSPRFDVLLMNFTTRLFTFADLVTPLALMKIANTAGADTAIESQEFTFVPSVSKPWGADGRKLEDLITGKQKKYPDAYSTDEHFRAFLIQHRGLLLLSNSAALTYNKLNNLVDKAESYLQSRNVTTFDFGGKSQAPHVEIATLRQRLSAQAGQPLIVTSATMPDGISLDGLPEAVFVTAADTQFTHRTIAGDITANVPEDTRVIFDSQRGLFTVGETVDSAFQAMDIAQRGAQIIAAANQLGGYNAPDVSGWGETLPQPQTTRRQFDGEVVLITGAASGIGKATAEVFLERGTAVIGLDINPKITEMFAKPQFLGIHADVRKPEDVQRAVNESVQTYGGIDMVFLNAGINEDHAPLEDANMELWDWVMETNVDGNMIVLKAVYEVLKRAPKGGRIIMNASKSAPAPGPGSSSYTVSKAAITQLGRLTALEWGKDDIRVYVVHPNAVFDTLIWKNNMAEKRAKHYGMTLQQYKTNNLLKVEIMARDVGEIVADLCGDHFRKVTGIQLPIDGGNNRVI